MATQLLEFAHDGVPSPATRAATHQHLERNPGVPYDRAWIDSLRVNLSAVERRAETLSGRRTLKKAWQAAWLLKAATCIDLTTLAGDDTPGRVARLCAKARAPFRPELLDALGVGKSPLHVGAVCVYHAMIATAVDTLAGTDIPVAAVSTGFPAGQSPLATKLEEIAASVAAGAHEIDIVISRRHVLTGDWHALYDEMAAFRAACGPARVKAIVAAGDLGSFGKVAKASTICMMAGADFVKTSTGMETTNASLPISLVMVRTIRDFAERTGVKIGFKPAGGITTSKQALGYLILVKEELGDAWLTPQLLRLGTSRLLSDIERQLDHFVTGRYSAAHRHALG
jgi:deoxyribose-phosphate aldolase